MASTSEVDQPQRPRTASRIMNSVKRSLTPSSSSPKKRHPEYSKTGMHSTREESSASPPPAQFRDPDPAASRPTIEQIAMGLHVSRTPHLRPLAASPYAFSQRNSATPHSTREHHHNHRSTAPAIAILPPPPTRSSMKKPAATTTLTSSSSSPAVSPHFSLASGSSTTVTSMTPSASQQTPNKPVPIASVLRLRMSRFLLPHARSTSAPPSPIASPRHSGSESPQPRKAVRFEGEDDDED